MIITLSRGRAREGWFDELGSWKNDPHPPDSGGSDAVAAGEGCLGCVSRRLQASCELPSPGLAPDPPARGRVGLMNLGVEK
jgi:hypothetical protein